MTVNNQRGRVQTNMNTRPSKDKFNKGAEHLRQRSKDKLNEGAERLRQRIKDERS